ncbi:MAG: hypothetical protein HC881_18700 [Leptolyngbyaceae cyanobacterium SL_7_1]|nr:hypothetical protein [Leptolyngbyaceae cyanobacterium SL_7_1]
MSNRLFESLRVSMEEAIVPQPPDPERERLQVFIIGSREGVMETIYSLHHRGFAEVNDWSPLLPVPESGELMSVLRRERWVGRSAE